MAVLVRDHAHARVLGLRREVEDPLARVRDLVPAVRRVDGLRAGPLGVRALLAAVVGLVGARVHEHDVVEHAVGLEASRGALVGGAPASTR